MVFNSLAFACFFPLVLALYFCLGRRGQNAWLLLASWFFYAWWDWRFLSLILISTLVDFFCSRAIFTTDDARRRKRLLVISLLTNLGLLGVFKYYDFFIDSAVALLNLAGLSVHHAGLRLVLPMGISFYTFQTIAYTVDVYRGELKPCRDPIDFALFVSYFPQLVAGPIERAGDLLPRLQNPRRVTFAHIASGSQLILLGLFKKVAVADAIAPYADAVFLRPEAFSAADLLAGIYLFALQIYCDFSGYSDLARGTSRWLGIPLRLNFRQPYFASSISDFWRRWHMSLSSWLRDYLYISLGGNRLGARRTECNLMLTMLLGGLWHGANWTFVVWGGLHGVYLSLHKRMRKFSRDLDRGHGRLYALASTVVVFHLVCLSWIFFRAPDFSRAWQFLEGLTRWNHGAALSLAPWTSFRVILLATVAVLLDAAQHFTGRERFFADWPPWLRGVLYAGLILILLCLGGIDADVPFIYFQF